MSWLPGWPPQDKDTEEKTEPTTPWWVENWYVPGTIMGIVALVILGISPWTGDSPGRWVGSALAIIGIGGVITVVYGFRSDAYGATAKKVERAERDIRVEWGREASWEHCHKHCECGYCRNCRNQQMKVIEP
jgi:hypothetical protein